MSSAQARSGRRKARQRQFWDRVYRQDPQFFGPGPSSFARWVLPRMTQAHVRSVLELGAGYGRDLRWFERRGFRVEGVDISSVAARAGSRTSPTVLHRKDAFQHLASVPPGSFDAVYSHLFYNMDLTDREHRVLFQGVHRALAPGGLHFFSVRSVTDAWYGKGQRVRPDTYDLAPHGPTLHFFSPLYVEELSRVGFRTLDLQERRLGSNEVPMRVLYVAQRAIPTSRA